MSEQPSFTLHDICKVMYRVGIPEHFIALEICALSGKPLTYDEIHSMLKEAMNEELRCLED